MHTPSEIGGGQNQFIVSGIPDPLISAAVCSRPVSGLIGTWNRQEEPDIRMIRTEGQDFFRGQRIKTQSSAADKPAGTLLITPENGVFQAQPDFRHPFPVNPAVPGETYRILFKPRCSAS